MSRRGRSLEYHIVGLVGFLFAWMATALMIWLSCVLMTDPLVAWSFWQSIQAAFIGITIVRAGIILESIS